MPNPILESIKGTPYEKYAIPFLTNKLYAGMLQTAQMIDKDLNRPRKVDGKINPENLDNKIGELCGWEQSFSEKDPNPVVEPKIEWVAGMTLANRYYYCCEMTEDYWPKGMTGEEVNRTAAQKLDAACQETLRQYHEWVERHKHEKNFSLFQDMMECNLFPLDHEAGDFTAAMMDNPYLTHLQGQNGGMPKMEKYTIQELTDALGGEDDPEVSDVNIPGRQKEAKPLKTLAAFYKAQTELFKAEYRKQKMMKNGYTPEEEADYLRQLQEATGQEIAAFDKLYDFVTEHPGMCSDINDKYGTTFMNNELDHITGVAGSEKRDCFASIGYLRGQELAIDNGWGMEELAHLGTLGQLKATLDWQIRKDTYALESDSTLKGEENAEKRRQKEEQLRQNKALLADMQTLDESVMHRKVWNKRDKLEVLSTISDFVKEKTAQYPASAITKVYGTTLKAFVKDATEYTKRLPQIDKAIEGLRDGNRGTWFGKDDYDKVIRNMEELNALYKQNAQACQENGPRQAIPHLQSKQAALLAEMNAYMIRKESEFTKNANAGKKDNANSRRRYNAMSKAMEALKDRMAAEELMENERREHVKMDFSVPAPEEEVIEQEAPKAEAPKAEVQNKKVDAADIRTGVLEFDLDDVELGEPVFDLDVQRLEIQEELCGLGEDGIPDKEDIKAELAGIIAVNLLHAQQRAGKLDKVTQEDYNDMRESVEVDKAFETLINSRSSEELFKHATRDRGQDLYQDFRNALEMSQKQPEVQERTGVRDLEINRNIAK
ncbi:MAG: hypothetical protein IJV04_10130 [Lachnospiraceae bacterium]|nr:hypothetical protein [Lachnospiraceae bacterium]MBR1459549.1 hypothetical protein [Oscillospiraceae bacterium]